MNKKIYVLGAGLVGRAIAMDLKNSQYDVTAVDMDPAALNSLHTDSGIRIIEADITESALLRKIIDDASLVVGAMPGRLGYAVMKNVILAGKNITDISFCPEDYFELDDLARENHVTVIPDIGIAPGLSHVICGYHNRRMEVNSFTCMVGGLPSVREWPLEYKATWSPYDVIEEYMRPARLMVNGKEIVREALSDLEMVNIEGIGTLEAWNSDGLRSLLNTMSHIPDMTEKTLRYPGTTQYLKVLRELGFFSASEVDISGIRIKPVDFTARMLFPHWELKKGEMEFTVMTVSLSGLEKGREKTFVYKIYDEYDVSTGISSMARCTGYTCAAAASMILEGHFSREGVCPPEYLGEDEANFNYILGYLSQRNISVTVETREI